MIEAIENLEIEDVMERPYLDINKLPSRIAFNKRNGIKISDDEESQEPIECWPCDETGHCMTQSIRRAEDLNLRNCILLDSESTVHAFCNEKW